MRSMFVLLHRWVGLLIAGFLFVSGITGAVISWDHELDEWLNPHLVDAKTVGEPLPVLELVRQAELRHPTMQVLHTPLATEPGHALDFFVEPRVNPATGELYPDTFNQIFVDPVSGEELGTRNWGGVWPISKENFVSFLYVLHYSLHIPAFWGIDMWGVWLMGVIALLWTLDCFTGFYLTLPKSKSSSKQTKCAKLPTQSWWQRWWPAWKVRWKKGSYKLNFDLHRAFSLWTWGLLFVVAFTAFSLNLYRDVFFPLMSLVSDVTPSPYDLRAPTAPNKPIIPALDYATIISRAEAMAKARGWEEPAGSIFYGRQFGLYSVDFYYPEDDHGSGGVGHRSLVIDAMDGAELAAEEPWKGTVADIFVQAQFPLHSGRILGMPGRILISLMGLVVATLSVTGVIIWWRKYSARIAKQAKPAPMEKMQELSPSS